MSQIEESIQPPSATSQKPMHVRLPGFISDEAIGLGDVIKKATATMGIKTCGGCQRRAEALNRWISFTGWRSH